MNTVNGIPTECSRCGCSTLQLEGIQAVGTQELWLDGRRVSHEFDAPGRDWLELTIICLGCGQEVAQVGEEFPDLRALEVGYV